MKEWFSEWFDSPYYHTLYKQHDEKDAQRALDNLLQALNLPQGSRILDLACGKGRHARHLADQGYDVTGLDISNASIAFARQFEHERLAFYQYDMRLPYRVNYFDGILNMFTSFGYFQHDRDHLLVLKNVQKGLKPGGLFLLDYFNSVWVRAHLVRQEVKIVDNIEFYLKKSARMGHVYKTVEFTTGGRPFKFRERVRLFTLADFEQLYAAAGLQLVQTFGGYDLCPYDPEESKRLIMIVRKAE